MAIQRMLDMGETPEAVKMSKTAAARCSSTPSGRKSAQARRLMATRQEGLVGAADCARDPRISASRDEDIAATNMRRNISAR